MAASKAATTLSYTENEVAAIAILREQNEPKTAKELGVSTAVLTSIMKKQVKFADDENVVVLEKTDYEDVCPTCGAVKTGKKYMIVR